MSKKKILIIGIILVLLLIIAIIVFFILRQDNNSLKHEMTNASLTNKNSYEELNGINNTNIDNTTENNIENTITEESKDGEEETKPSDDDKNEGNSGSTSGNTGNSGSSSGSSDKNDNKPSKPADDDKEDKPSKPSKPSEDDKDEKPSKDPTPTGEFIYKHNSSIENQIIAKIQSVIDNDEMCQEWGAKVAHGTAGKGHGFTYRGINAHDWRELINVSKTNYVYVQDEYCVYSDGSTVKTGMSLVYIYK